MDEQEVGWLHYVGSHYTQYVNINIQQHEGCLFTLLDLEVGGCSLWLMWGLQTHVSSKKNKGVVLPTQPETLKNVIYAHPHMKNNSKNNSKNKTKNKNSPEEWSYQTNENTCVFL